MKKTFHTLLAFSLLTAPFYIQADAFSWSGVYDKSAQESWLPYMNQIQSRFQLSDREFNIIATIADKPSDIFLVLRLSELSKKPINEVLTLYQWHKKSGWGVIAQQIGIKPGSDRFKEIGKPVPIHTAVTPVVSNTNSAEKIGRKPSANSNKNGHNKNK